MTEWKYSDQVIQFLDNDIHL